MVVRFTLLHDGAVDIRDPEGPILHARLVPNKQTNVARLNSVIAELRELCRPFREAKYAPGVESFESVWREIEGCLRQLEPKLRDFDEILAQVRGSK